VEGGGTRILLEGYPIRWLVVYLQGEIFEKHAVVRSRTVGHMVKAVELSLCKVGDLNNRLPMSYALWWTRLLQSAFDSLEDGMQEMWKGCLVRSLMRLASSLDKEGLRWLLSVSGKRPNSG
jgi:hypothetical protein